MKNYYAIMFIGLILIFASCKKKDDATTNNPITNNPAPKTNTWNKKADFGGTARAGAVGFSIGSKGYIGTGQDISGDTKDFWEWDQTTNVWTQKADFGGGSRESAVGFSIGTKGYIGTGLKQPTPFTFYKDFWEWDQATNVWIQKSDFTGTGRRSAVGFAIGTKGYIGTGYDSTSATNDFYEWDQTTDAWLQKSNCGGSGRGEGVGFSIGTKGYIVTGWVGGSMSNDFWEWDQSADTWIQQANFGGAARADAAAFSIGTKGYIGTGDKGSTLMDFWEWNQGTNVWTQKTNYQASSKNIPDGFSFMRHGGSPIVMGGGASAIGIPIGSKGYFATGGSGYTKDFWEYTPN